MEKSARAGEHRNQNPEYIHGTESQRSEPARGALVKQVRLIPGQEYLLLDSFHIAYRLHMT